jgi:integrase
MNNPALKSRLKFSKERLEKLPLPDAGKRLTYYDTDVPKLAIRVTSAGTKTFYVVRRTGREMIWFKLGVFPDMTVEQSRKEAAKALAAFAGEDNPAAARRAAKGMPTFAEFFKEYGERHGQAKKSWRDDQQRYRDYLEKPLGNRKLDAITREMIGRILSDMDRAKKAGATINNVRALASSIFGKAIEWSYVRENPVRGIKTRKAIKRDRFVEASELPRFFASVGQELNETIRDYLLLSLLTGARRANVLAMRWDQVNLAEGIWRIPDTKNGTPQNVTISPEAKAILESRSEVADGPFVFPGEGESGHLVEPKAGWQRILDRDELVQLKGRLEAAGEAFQVVAGESLAKALQRARKAASLAKVDTQGCRLQNLRIHDLRRTLGSWQAKQGASLAIIGKSLNHKSLQTTMIYARLDLDPVRSSVNAATAAITEAATKGAAINTARTGSAK